MSKADEIPTTVYVPQLPLSRDLREVWFGQLASWIEGGQANKVMPITGAVVGESRSLRVGNVVFVEGSITVPEIGIYTIKALTVSPLKNGFLSFSESVGNTVRAASFLAGDQNATFSASVSGLITFSGWYLAAQAPRG